MTAAREFKAGDRVSMRSGAAPEGGGEGPMLFGTVEEWTETGGLIVVWDGWPLVTALPNPNVLPLVEVEGGP